MQKDEIAKLDAEMEPFLVKAGDNEHQYYKTKYDIDMTGKLTKAGELKWLEFRNVITLVDAQKGQYKIRVDKRTDGITSCKNYEKTCELLEAYLNAKARISFGKMGTKQEQKKVFSKDEINPEEIPF